MKTRNKYMDGSRVTIGGHRGDRRYFPENTMPAFRSAVEMGCDAIETDVRMTKDGHLVLIHDRSVERTTNGKGFVDEMTLDEIKALDAGSWKAPEFAGEKIPTVEEFLEYVSGTDTVINWELKEYPLELGDRAYVCIDKLCELIDRYGMAEKSILNSFSERDLEYAYDKYGEKYSLHGYMNYKHPKDHANKPVESFMHWMAVWNKDASHPAGFEEDYELARKNDMLCCILVADTEEQYKMALDMGCRMFTSDDPAEGIRVLKAIGER